MLNNLARIAYAQGRLDEAQRYLEESLAIARETQYAQLEEAARANLAALAAARNEGSEG